MRTQPCHKEKELVMKLAWRSFAILAVCFVIVSFFRASTSTLAVDIMHDFQVGGGLMSVMSSAFFYPYGIMQLPAGIMADRWGARKVTSGFLLLAACGGFLFSCAQSVGMATTGRIIMGLGLGMVFVPSLKVLLAWFPHDRYVMSVGHYLSIGALGMLVASYPLASLTALLGWRGSMVMASVLTVFLAATVWVFIRNTPEEIDLPVPTKIPAVQESHLDFRTIVCTLLHCRDYWFLCIWLFAVYGTFYALTSLWAGPYFTQGYDLSSGQVGMALLLLAAGGAVSPSVAGTLAYRWRWSKRTILIFSTCGAIISAIPLIIAERVISVSFIPVWCFILGFFSGGFGCIAMSKIQEMVTPQILGTATGLANVFSYGGATFLQLFSGLYMEFINKNSTIYTINDYADMFILFIMVMVFSLICVIFCKK